MSHALQAATDWLSSTDGEHRLKDVHDEFLTKDFCRGLTPEQTRQLFTAAMYNYVVLGEHDGRLASVATMVQPASQTSIQHQKEEQI